MIYSNLLNKITSIAVVGLGYVGLPLAYGFSKKIKTIGFDISKFKIERYKRGIDVTKEIGDILLKTSKIQFTFDENDLKKSSFIVVAVPTPINEDKTPDLSPVIGASQTVGRNLTKGSIVVYESTVYPGVTEDICVPILEKESGLKCGTDFKVGYSPERINPGDHQHRLHNITKIVSGMDAESLEEIANVYKLVVTDADIYKAQSIKVAEAAKVIENSQRDINIAFMNELSIIFHKMGIDTQEVLKAAGTKWNFLKFYPGLVGGHCIGVDPYYLTYKSSLLGYESQVILAGRKINDSVGKYVAENIVKSIIKANKIVNKAIVGILGFTFKEDCQDTRNTKVMDIIKELREYNIEPIIVDPIADKEEAKHEYQIDLVDSKKLYNLDALIVSVSHKEFKTLTPSILKPMFPGTPILFDLKGILDKKLFESEGFSYWRL
jgi:UDP-N-acetyl-D-glucosamine/UDP-N-acetyl-D-galactosamine dehydrogenase